MTGESAELRREVVGRRSCQTEEGRWDGGAGSVARVGGRVATEPGWEAGGPAGGGGDGGERSDLRRLKGGKGTEEPEEDELEGGRPAPRESPTEGARAAYGSVGTSRGVGSNMLAIEVSMRL